MQKKTLHRDVAENLMRGRKPTRLFVFDKKDNNDIIKEHKDIKDFSGMVKEHEKHLFYTSWL